MFYILSLAVFVHIFITGFHDEGNLIATIISSRSIKARTAFALAAFSQFLGTFFLGTSVASTIGKSIIKQDFLFKDPNKLQLMLLAVILSTITWNVITWYLEIPTSSSHALIGGLLGPFFVEYGLKAINITGVMTKVILPLFLSPIIGFFVGYTIMGISVTVLRGYGPGVNKLLKRLQFLTIFLLNSSQGTNDAQKGMGIIAIAILQANTVKNFSIPLWIKLISALMISTGLVLGGLKMVKSVGARIYKVKPLHSFNAQLASIIVIVPSNMIGAPISGTQIINTSIMGVGAKERPNGVRWYFVKSMMIAWIVTIPFSFIMSVILYLIMRSI